MEQREVGESAQEESGERGSEDLMEIIRGTTERSLKITVLKIGLIGRLIGRLILFGGSPLNITLIALIMLSDN